MTFRERVMAWLFGDLVENRIKQAVKVVDDQWWRRLDRGRHTTDRDLWEIQADYRKTLEIWRNNPFARRIVAVQTAYVLGGGLKVESKNQVVNGFIERFWKHRKNQMEQRIITWSDELARAGELFVALFTNEVDGMTYVRLVPASEIDQVVTDNQDYENELRYHQLGININDEGTWWLAKDMLHYSVNRVPGGVRGESDISYLVPWLKRYDTWLEDRATLNHHKSAFVWDVTVPSGRVEEKAEQYKTPPSAGEVIVHDEGEKWAATQPKIDAQEARDDGKAMRQMIAVGAGMPPHFLSDPEGSTQTTAKSSTGPTFRQFRERQKYVVWMLKDLVEVVVARAVGMGKLDVRGDYDVEVQVTDLNEEDNLQLAQATRNISQALLMLYDRGLVDDETVVAMAMRFSGEVLDPRDILQRAKKNSGSNGSLKKGEVRNG